MHGLQVQNDRVLLRVFRDARFDFRLMADDKFYGTFKLQQGSAEIIGTEPVKGLLYYAMPCVFESLIVRIEGTTTPVINRTVGDWPASIDDDELEMYPYLHFLEERRTGMPWRFERWYTLGGPYLVFDSEQYFERSRPQQRGKNWERLIVQLRQVVDLNAWAQNIEAVAINLISRRSGDEN